MPIEQYTYWSITINNPDENDMLIVRNPNEKYVRSFIWTPEVGEEGTQHVQGWLRLQRNQSMAFVKKLYPRAHLKNCDKDEYNENSQRYAQKNDETTAGNHEIILHDPLPANDTLLYKVLERSFERYLTWDKDFADRVIHEGLRSEIFSTLFSLKKIDCELTEREMIMERSGYEKIFVSPAYEKMKAKYWREIIYRIFTKKDGESGLVDETGSTGEKAAQTTDRQEGDGDSESSTDTDEETDESYDSETSGCGDQSSVGD